MQLSDCFEITTRQINALKAAHINTTQELLDCLPKHYYDMSKVVSLSPEISNEFCGIVGEMTEIITILTKSGREMTIATVIDDKSGLELKVNWMCEKYRKKMYAVLTNEKVLVYGKISYSPEYKSYNTFAPIIFKKAENDRGIFCTYRDIKNISDESLKKCIKAAVDNYQDADLVPEKIRKHYGLLDKRSAYYHIHFPKNMDVVTHAKKRFVFDELLYFSLQLEADERGMSRGSSFNIKTLKKTRDMENSLAYSLTTPNGQKEVLEDILSDMRDGRRVDAVIQGDVGCGKSIVAFLLLSAVAENGGQAVMMASTSVLARQHYEEMEEYAIRYGYGIAYLDGGVKASEKRRILAGLENGNISILIGTHSVFSPSVKFKNLTLAIMDEEHKYGVKQREALIAKGGDGVHVVSMSATPIPRSIAGTVYNGNRKLYSIEKMPGNRLPIKTTIFTGNIPIMRFLEREIKQGRQAYVICPLVDKKEENWQEIRSVEETLKGYRAYYNNTGIRVEALTGKTKKADKEEIIDLFTVNKIQILISTTVVEVGVNVPNASVIVINNAERYGIASLHQLRGRVGRGKYQSYCILNSDDKENERLKVIASTTSGFEIAEADYELRGAGNVIGVEQTGKDKNLALAMQYPAMFKKVREIAAQMYEDGTGIDYLENIEKGRDQDKEKQDKEENIKERKE